MSNAQHVTEPVQLVYERHGVRTERRLSCAGRDPEVLQVPTIADTIPVTQIMTREVTCAHRDLPAAKVVELVVNNRIGCVPVVEAPGRPIGMVTKLDLVEQLMLLQGGFDCPTPNDLTPRTAFELMMPLAITLGERATIAHAAALMDSEDVHHIPIVDGAGKMIGIVSSMDIVRWLARNDGFGIGSRR